MSKTVAASLLLKPAMLVVLYALINRVADLTGFQLSLISPIAGFVVQLTGISTDDAMVLVIGVVAFCFLRVLTAAYGFFTAPLTHSRFPV
jgi:hypothetical protein